MCHGDGQRSEEQGRTERRGIHVIVSTKRLDGPSIKRITGKRRQFREEKRDKKKEITNEPREAQGLSVHIHTF